MSDQNPINVKCLALRYKAVTKSSIRSSLEWAVENYYDWVMYSGVHYKEARHNTKPDEYLEQEFLFRGFKPLDSFEKRDGFNYIQSNCPINGKYYIYPKKFVRGHTVNNWLNFPNVYAMHNVIGVEGFTKVDVLYT